MLSPNRRYLAVQDPSGSGTWLVELDGEESARKIIDVPAEISWSPDGKRLAWFYAGTLYLQAVPGGETRPLACWMGCSARDAQDELSLLLSR